ncbi:LAFA_0B03884g1_1 [Lachancea sp. 'fantastica']|nr:LAFA_0B03884g1_1 [Lachancea sp. 'fantastica']
MGFRNVAAPRFYSTLKDTMAAKSAKKAVNEETWKELHRAVPKYHESIQPFYHPNVAERAILCATENCPRLLDGHKIVPAIIKRPRDITNTLVNARWMFKSVSDAQKWITDYRGVESARQNKRFALIEDRDVEQILRPSRLDPSQFSELQKFADFYRKQGPAALDTVLISGLIESLTSLPVIKVFSEEVFLYILQHYCRTKHGVVGLTHSIIEFLHKDIDDFKVAELLVLQLLVTLRQKQVPVDADVFSAVTNLLIAISERFHKSNCVLDFSPATIQAVLDLHLEFGNLNEAKMLLAHLVNRHICPQSAVLERYLLLVDETVGPAGSPEDFLKKFAYISDFKLILEKAITPTIASLLIPYCRHFDEILSLLDIISRSRLKKQIWDQTLPQLVRRVSLLENDTVTNSCNLSVLLQRAQQVYGSSLSNKVLQAFIVQYATNGNFAMVTNLMSRLDGQVSANFSAGILTASDSLETSSSFPGFRVDDKRAFIKSSVLPRYSSLSVAGRLSVVKNAETEDILEQLLRMESSVEGNEKKSLLHEVIAKAKSSGLESLTLKYAK